MIYCFLTHVGIIYIFDLPTLYVLSFLTIYQMCIENNRMTTLLLEF